MRRACSAAVVAAAIALGGCGEHRTHVSLSDVPLTAPITWRATVIGGLAFALPEEWVSSPGAAPLVLTAGSATATVALWRYPRTQPLPTTARQLRTAMAALLAAVRARDGSFVLRGQRILRIGGLPVLQVVGEETIDGRRRRVRSDHVFAHGTEVVVDAYAPREYFARVDRAVFLPLLRSLRVRGSA